LGHTDPNLKKLGYNEPNFWRIDAINPKSDPKILTVWKTIGKMVDPKISIEYRRKQ